VAKTLSNRGEVLNSLGRHREARIAFEGSIELLQRQLGPSNLDLAFPLTGIGLSYLGEGNPRNALAPLERAFELRKERELESSSKAQGEFALARALWDANRDRPRARRLAGEARRDYQRTELTEKLAEVQAWLTRHHG
jgi:tetratricopeptide (TPR) repeat protein